LFIWIFYLPLLYQFKTITMKAKKNYTDNQLSIINNLFAEFDKINEQSALINSDVISSIYQKAKTSANAEKEFYDNIEQNNNSIKLLKDELVESFYQKLVLLFKKHHCVEVVRSSGGISIGIIFRKTDRGTAIYGNKEFHIQFNIRLKTNAKGDITFHFNNDESKKGVTMFDFAYAGIDNVQLDLDTFENSKIFKDKVFAMFNEAVVKNVIA
jgi:hypothetical protein